MTCHTSNASHFYYKLDQKNTDMGSTNSKAKGRWAGKAVLFIATLHTVIGVAITARLIPDAAFDRLVGPDRNILLDLLTKWSWTPTDPILMSWFWFFLFGFALVPLGILLKSVEDKGQDVPKSVGWSLVVLGAGGAACMPASGFWTIFVPAWNILRR